MLCCRLYSSWMRRRRLVSSTAFLIEPVILSAYITTLPSTLRLARPMVWMSERSDLRNPSLSASRIATSVTSGRSSPSLSRLIPTSTSNWPRRRSRIISTRSRVWMSECIYRALISSSAMYSVRSSAIRLVRVVTSMRPPAPTSRLTSLIRSSTCPSTGRIATSGSTSPVGLIICSTTLLLCSSSKSPGVADMYIVWPARTRNSSIRSGLLS